MRIFTKKAFQFEKQNMSAITTKAMAFQDVPDWVKDTLLFELALKDGSVQVIADTKQQKELENDGMTQEEKELREQAKQLNIKKWQTLGITKLKKEITEKQKQLQQEEENGEREELPEQQEQIQNEEQLPAQ